MPRVKWIYVGDGEYVAPTADITTCPHPRNRLRFDSRFALPTYMYCTACGAPYISPLHGLSRRQIKRARSRARHLRRDLGWDDD